jgi:hypothetical protein
MILALLLALAMMGLSALIWKLETRKTLYAAEQEALADLKAAYAAEQEALANLKAAYAAEQEALAVSKALYTAEQEAFANFKMEMAALTKAREEAILAKQKKQGIAWCEVARVIFHKAHPSPCYNPHQDYVKQGMQQTWRDVHAFTAAHFPWLPASPYGF